MKNAPNLYGALTHIFGQYHSNSQFGPGICVNKLVSALFTLKCHAERSEASLWPRIFQGTGMLRGMLRQAQYRLSA